MPTGAKCRRGNTPHNWRVMLSKQKGDCLISMSDLFQDYSEAAARTGAYDEMFAPGQLARRSYGQVAEALRKLSLTDVSARADSMARTFLDRGVTFDYAG